VSTINKYTDHTTELYAKVNLALASDSVRLTEHGEFVAELRASILAKPLLNEDYGLLFRGVDLSTVEVEQMERLSSFFIPSFTSTSVDPEKAYRKSHNLVIKVPYACHYACSITSDLSRFYGQEREVLLACYSAFTLERIEKVGGKSVMTLYLNEFYSGLRNI